MQGMDANATVYTQQGPSSEDGARTWMPKLEPGAGPASDTESTPPAQVFAKGPDGDTGPNHNRQTRVYS